MHHHHRHHGHKKHRNTKEGQRWSDETIEQLQIPRAAWMRQMSDIYPPCKEFSVNFFEALKVIPLGWRMWKHTKAVKAEDRAPIMDPFTSKKPSPLMGVPIGGIGSGGITRGWRGDFIRWSITNTGMTSMNNVEADQFSIRIKRNDHIVTSVLHAGPPQPSAESPNRAPENSWNFSGISGRDSFYHAMFPRAWSIYNEPDPNLTITCKQLSPVIANNYQGVFVYQLHNHGKEEVNVDIMWTMQNGHSNSAASEGSHSNEPFDLEGERKIRGIKMTHRGRRNYRVDGAKKNVADTVQYGMGVIESEDVRVTRRTTFHPMSVHSCKELWNEFQQTGNLKENPRSIREQHSAVGGALTASVSIPPGQMREIVFSFGWDSPYVLFGSSKHARRYTKFYGREGDHVTEIVRDALTHYNDWEAQVRFPRDFHEIYERKIDQWQSTIYNDPDLPPDYVGALFNELYFIVDGGTVWTEEDDRDDDIGKFAYLEGLEYLMYNTYDVHFYASFALIMNWPKLELSLQRDIATATRSDSDEKWTLLHSGEEAMRKKKGAVPHDIGTPGEAPWVKVNSYCIQDVSRWKDLPSKFILQVYRDYVATEDKLFLENLLPVVLETFEYLRQFDTDGFPDQTYDIWSAKGISAYSGGLYLACLSAVIEMCKLVPLQEGDLQASRLRGYEELYAMARNSYHDSLWNGTYYNYDSCGQAHSDSIMADMLAGHWYAKICMLSTYVKEEEEMVKGILDVVYENNVVKFGKKMKEKVGHHIGAVNGMRPSGVADTTSIQSQEVWTGTTYALASTMILEGKKEMAFDTARGIIDTTYNTFGYAFQTPEGWDSQGRYRAYAYQRPLAIWSMQWAWHQMKK
ncbi:non-lysosomal glucosylceramidase isoform 6 [Planoprotostelium fungivorum]|uniref:Non-lysosomal glucosylceramidase isoform 6 n=1 Tax=Planoprotostelium fungivorum TaxID=1890364 RepID=A0A2P6NPC5_9EUKA|nr:non-lysosomal glucosylceramidase isoform 6 [Planoprotostelium fungivorum]